MAEAKTDGLARWKARVTRVAQAIDAAARQELPAEADELIGEMKSRVHSATGATAQSIRKEPGSSDLQVIVRAGGELTTKPVRVGASAQYDYALGEEYGNKHSPAHPFFWPAWRAKKAEFKRRRRDAIAKAIAEADR